MADDLNTPVALAALYRGVSRILAAHRTGALDGDAARAFLDGAQDVLGVVRPTAPLDSDEPADDGLAEQVEALLAERAHARAARDWPRADALRAEIDALGVDVMDAPDGATWKRRAA